VAYKGDKVKIFIDLETLLNSLSLEQKIHKITRGTVNLKSLPYNSRVIYLMEQNYREASIVILAKEEYEKECERACEELNLFNKGNWNISYLCYKKTKQRESIIDFDALYISNSIRDPLLKKTKYSALVSDSFSCLYYWLFSKNCSHILSNGLNGLLNILFSHFSFIIPLLILWPAFFEIKSSIINRKALEYSIYATMNTFFFSSLLRSIIEVDNERKEYTRGFTPLCSKVFIYKPNSLKIAIVYLIISFLFAIFLFSKDYLSIIPTILMGIANFTSLLLPQTARYATLSFFMLYTQIICQWKFFKVFIRTII
jgi:hypothetical protein